MNTREELKAVCKDNIDTFRTLDKKYSKKSDDFTWICDYTNFTFNFIKDAGCKSDVFVSYNSEKDKATYLQNFSCLDDFVKYCEIL